MVKASIIFMPIILVSLIIGIAFYLVFRRSNINVPQISEHQNETGSEGTNENLTSTSMSTRHGRISLASFTNFGFSNSQKDKKGAVGLRSEVKCGRPYSNYNYRIVDGKLATISEFPWIVSIQREKSFWFGFKTFFHSCGGSIITESWILTAAHCLYNHDDNARIVAGTDNMNFLYKAQIRSAAKIIIHPDFDIVSYDNDIGLIKLDKPLNLNSKFSRLVPICLDTNVPVLAYDIATVCGFGAPAFKKHSQSHLYQADIAIIDKRVCNESFDGTITENMICAGGMIAQKRDACSGDSGGPLEMEVDDHETLIGIVSFGNNCASKGYPGVYTKVENYYDWILENIDEDLYEP